MANTFYLKQGDTYPDIYTTLSDKSGPVNLSGCTVFFRMSQVGTGNLMIDLPAVVLGQGQTENLGRCYYVWQNGDTDVIGTYRVEWRVIFPNGKVATFPRGNTVSGNTTVSLFNQVVIQEDVD